MSKHKVSMIFLSLINLMSVVAGFIAMIKIITGSDVTSVIPISAELTVNQILIVNLIAVTLVMMLLSVVTMYLVCDISYSPLEVLSNCAFVFLILPIIVLALAVFCSFKAEITADKICIIAGGVMYLLFNAINISCLLTIKEDSEL